MTAQRYGSVTYSYSGIDLIVLNALDLLGISTTASYLDIGAHHPTVISNTALLYGRGLRGVNVEANPNLIENFLRDRPEDVNLNIGVAPQSGELEFYMIDKWSGRNTFSHVTALEFIRAYPQFSISEVIRVPVLSLNDLVDKHIGGRFPEFLSIDIEQLDFHVLRAADFSHSHPRVICAETIDTNGVQLYHVFRDMMLAQGFVTYCRAIFDTIFIWHEDAIDLGLWVGR